MLLTMGVLEAYDGRKSLRNHVDIYEYAQYTYADPKSLEFVVETIFKNINSLEASSC